MVQSSTLWNSKKAIASANDANMATLRVRQERCEIAGVRGIFPLSTIGCTSPLARAAGCHACFLTTVIGILSLIDIFCLTSVEQPCLFAGLPTLPLPQPPRHFDDIQTGGIKFIPIQTSAGTFKVWTKRVGNNPRIKVLLLHGGPGCTHEYFEACDSFFPGENIEYYYYDQLGSYYSDQPEKPELWDTARFVEEVEQVRQALNLDRNNFYLLGHSWGGVLAMEYALKYQQNLKGLIISNMMASIPAYNDYAQKVLMPKMDQKALAEIKQLEEKGEFEKPRYMELLMQHHYVHHVLRMPADQWPDPVNRTFKHLNQKIYVLMQGPSELGASGKLLKWDRTADLSKITVPTLTIGAQHDTMDPEHMKWMSTQVKNGRYLHCPNGSHMAMYDDQKAWFGGVIKFVKDVDTNGKP